MCWTCRVLRAFLGVKFWRKDLLCVKKLTFRDSVQHPYMARPTLDSFVRLTLDSIHMVENGEQCYILIRGTAISNALRVGWWISGYLCIKGSTGTSFLQSFFPLLTTSSLTGHSVPATDLTPKTTIDLFQWPTNCSKQKGESCTIVEGEGGGGSDVLVLIWA